jgi:hypothetical protein
MRVVSFLEAFRRKLPLREERRRFLAVAVGCLSGAAFPAALVSALGSGGAKVAWEKLFPDARAAAAVGRQYLRQYPQEASAEWLMARLFADGAPIGADEVSPGRVLAVLRDGQRLDFPGGDVVVVHGWFVGRTEARLLALLSLRVFPARC